MVKDLLVENIDGHAIYFCGDAARIAKPDEKDKCSLLLACLLSQLK